MVQTYFIKLVTRRYLEKKIFNFSFLFKNDTKTSLGVGHYIPSLEARGIFHFYFINYPNIIYKYYINCMHSGLYFQIKFLTELFWHKNLERFCSFQIINFWQFYWAGIVTLSIMTLSIMALSITTLSITTLSIMTLSIMTRSIITRSIMAPSNMGLIATLSISNTKHNNSHHNDTHP